MRAAAAKGPGALRRLERLILRSPLVLAMDFDGTLAPIVPRPSQARLPVKTAAALRAVAKLPGVVLLLISGRALSDLKRRCPVRGAAMAGVHGLSATVKGVGMDAAEARRWRSVLVQARARLRLLRLGQAGVRFEDKGLGLALHLRKVRPDARKRLLPRLARLLKGLPLSIRRGIDVLELVPPGRWDKGWALQRLAEALAPDWRRRGACLFVGDDRSDEDAFKALRRMGRRTLGIKIGPGPSAAGHRFRRPAELRLLLERIHYLRSLR